MKNNRTDSKELALATAAALALSTATAKTAEALAAAKVNSDTASALLAADVKHIQEDITEIKQTLKDLANKEESYVLKEEFYWWRNLIVSGMLLTVFISAILKMIGK